MEPNKFVKKLKEYPLVSHKAWKLGDGVLKMDWNEGDMPAFPHVKKAVIDFVKKGKLQWYPDVANKELVSALARYVKVPQNFIQYFAGEDAALDYVVRTFLYEGDEVVIVSPTYDNFRVYVESVGAIPKFIFPKNIFKPDLAIVSKSISDRTKMVYIVNPNNPTGTLYTLKEIEVLLKKYPKTIFLLDEAYYEFADLTVVSLVEKYKNLIVGRSMSKAFGLASFRLGYIITDPQNLAHINKIRNGKSVPALSQIAAISALRHIRYVNSYVSELKKSKQLLVRGIKKLGLKVISTPNNFILIYVGNSRLFCESLERKDVFVRNMEHLPKMEGFVRVTVGRQATTKKFLSKAAQIIKNGSPKS